MKFSILNVLWLTAIAGLGIALYAEHSRNEQRESSLKSKHQEELQSLRNGLAVQHSFEHWLLNYHVKNQPSIRPDEEASALGLIASIFDNVDFLDQDEQLRAKYGSTPSLAIANELLERLDCDNADKYFQLYGKKIKALGMTGHEEHFGLGKDDSEKRKQLTTFIQKAIDTRADVDP